jgi:hypothetical protein
MEAIRQIIDSTLLSNVIPLPKIFQNKKVEVIVLLKEEQTALPLLTKDGIDDMLKNSVTESLIGVLPRSDMTLEDYRTERLTKYDCTN